MMIRKTQLDGVSAPCNNEQSGESHARRDAPALLAIKILPDLGAKSGSVAKEAKNVTQGLLGCAALIDAAGILARPS